jgi:hypothetical protein
MAIRHESFIDERVRALATMYLTRRKDLSLNFDEKVKDAGIDLLVDVLPAKANGHGDGRRMFGVQLKGANSSIDIAQAHRWFNSALKGKNHAPKLPFPLCLILFTMEDNQGYFSWLIEPAIQKGLAKLRTVNDKPSVKILDKVALDGIVESVNGWYDVFYSTISV